MHRELTSYKTIWTWGVSSFAEDTPTPQTCLPHMTFFSPTQSVLEKNVPRFLGKSGPHGEIILRRVWQGPHICALSHYESARGHLVDALSNLHGLIEMHGWLRASHRNLLVLLLCETYNLLVFFKSVVIYKQ